MKKKQTPKITIIHKLDANSDYEHILMIEEVDDGFSLTNGEYDEPVIVAKSYVEQMYKIMKGKK